MKIIIDCYIGNIMPTDAEPTKDAEEFGCNACEFISKNKIHRCSNFQRMALYNREGEPVGEEAKCANLWQNSLQIEVANNIRGMTAATESFRNESVHRQDKMIKLASVPSDIKLING